MFKRRTVPEDEYELPEVKTDFLITSRSLCTCLGQHNVRIKVPPGLSDSIVDVRQIPIPPEFWSTNETGQVPQSAINEVLRSVQSAFNTSWRLPSRSPLGEIGFLESDYFANRIRQSLDDDDLKAPLEELDGLDAETVERLGTNLTVDEVLSMGLADLREKSGLKSEDALAFQSKVLGRD